MFEDHKSISRFSGETESYKKLARALRRIALQSSDVSPALERASTHSSTLGEPPIHCFFVMRY
jgi:hypothetical protein